MRESLNYFAGTNSGQDSLHAVAAHCFDNLLLFTLAPSPRLLLANEVLKLLALNEALKQFDPINLLFATS